MITKPAANAEERVALPASPPWYSLHILKNQPYRYQAFDRLVTLRETGGSARPSQKTGRRSVVQGMSRPSRNRLLKLLAMVARLDCFAFVTLTTHENKTDWEESKDDFHRFRSNLQIQWPDVCGVWRFAWQARGAAHYHLLLWGFGDGDERRGAFASFLSRIWLKASGESGDAAAQLHAVDVAFGNDFRQCGFYVALYQADQSSAGVDEKQSGRQWGIIRRSKLDLRAKLDGSFSDNQAQYIRRVLRNVRRRRQMVRTGEKQRKGFGPLARRSGSFSAFLPVEEASRLFSYVERNVDSANRVVSTRLDDVSVAAAGPIVSSGRLQRDATLWGGASCFK